jgi:hypothetical protein
MRNKPLLKAILEAVCEMMAEPQPPDHDDAQEVHVSKVSLMCVCVCVCVCVCSGRRATLP